MQLNVRLMNSLSWSNTLKESINRIRCLGGMSSIVYVTKFYTGFPYVSVIYQTILIINDFKTPENFPASNVPNLGHWSQYWDKPAAMDQTDY